MRVLGLLLMLAVLLLVPVALAAQEADVLTGRITGPDGRALSGARVEAISAETEITRSGVTDGNGRYMIIFPDGGGRYLLRISYLGMADQVLTVTRDGEELLVVNAAMTTEAIPLDAIEARARRPLPGRGETGEQATALSQELVNRLPLPDLDPATLALLAAGVTATTADSLSGRMGFSVAGMSDLLNQVTLDGVILGEGGLGVPEEGVRRTQVTTSTFDASRGGFAGGQVAMTTARGTNRAGGALTYRLDDDALQASSAPTANAFTRHNVGGSWGGPLLRNRLFYNASFQLTRNTSHRFALTAGDPLATQRSGVSADSIARFLSILDGGLGMPVAGQTGAYDQLSRDLRLQGRADWSAVQRATMSQTLSLRFNYNRNDQDSAQIRTLDLLQHGGAVERDNRLAAVSLTSRFGTSWTNTLNASYSESWNDQLPYVEMPEGRVRVTSEFEDGTRGTSSLVFGGNRSMPSEVYSRDLQLSDDVSLLLPIGAQLHRLKLGGSLQKTRNVALSTDNLFGSYTFASLADFEANRPERYERALSPRDSRSSALHSGFYLGDTWRISQPLELTLGLRWDRSELDQRPAYNPLVAERFGRRTDITPAMSGWSPRIGFNYRLSGPGQPARALTGGLGVFAGRAPVNIFSSAVRQTGLPDAEQRLVCIGGAVPIPDWQLFLQDPAAAPAECAEGGPGVPDDFTQRAPAVTLIDPDQSLPSSLRLDFGYRTMLPLGISGNFRYTYSRGRGLWGYRDINLDESRSFTVAGEDRPFFGTAEAIVPATGAVAMTGSRIHPEFASVLDVRSDRESRTHQLTMQLGGAIRQKVQLFANYTLGFSDDQGSGSFFASTTAGNPNVAEWARSGNDRRHTVNLSLSYPVLPELEIAATARLASGRPFTPLVDRDINGDGARNDRAFVFDPATAADPAVAEGMSRLLATVSDRVRDCLTSQMGGIAGRNTCRDSWTQSLDLRLSGRPNLPRVERRLTVSIDARNVLTGLDQLVHGTDGMHGWGEGRRAESTLLEVRGFDPATQAFRYEVNENFGQATRGPGSFRNPFAITLTARLTVGGQPQLSNRPFGVTGPGRGGFGPGFRGAGGGPGGPGAPGGFEMRAERLAEAGFDFGALLRGGESLDVDSLLDAALDNPVRAVLALADSLALTPSQQQRLAPLADSLQAQLDRRRATLEPLVQGLAPAAGADPRQAGELRRRFQLEVQPQLTGARRESAEAMSLARRELTDEQWQRLPQPLRARAEQRAAGGFNAVGMLDRMLANPLPVLLSLRDSLQLGEAQVAQIEVLSGALQEKLNARREQLGQRFDNVAREDMGRVFGEVQPEIERTRTEVRDALRAVQRLLTREQWQRVPERVKDPYARVERGRQG
ncbi:MAG TPA: TonB-dependent receptor [Longimicrobiales bacterium]|nr:TonB-dependent receptor [Longimicrobiales bacterium]